MSFGFSASYIAIWAIVLFQALLIVALLRQLAELRRLLEMGGLQGEDHLPAGSAAPRFAGLDTRTGQQVGIRSLSGSGGAVLFLSPDCSVCENRVASMRQPAMIGLPPIVIFCQGGKQHCADFLKGLGSGVHLLQEGAEETAGRYGVSGFPTAVVIDANQKIRRYGHPKNVDDLRRLLARSLDANPEDADDELKPNLAVLSSKVSQ
jgi:hypothetical protein